MKYTEKDFQDYVAGSFSGDREAFERWIEENAGAKNMLTQYERLFSGLKPQPEVELTINLETKVMQALQARSVAKQRRAGIWNVVLTIIAAAVLVICWQFMNLGSLQVEAGLFAGAAIITVGFAIILNLLELKTRRDKFRIVLDS